MNARELADDLERFGLYEFTKRHQCHDPGDEPDETIILRALHLLATIEGANGETPECNAHEAVTDEDGTPIGLYGWIDIATQFERERNAALRKLAEAQSVNAGTDSVAEKVDELNNDLALIRKIISDQAAMITERERELAEARRALVDANSELKESRLTDDCRSAGVVKADLIIQGAVNAAQLAEARRMIEREGFKAGMRRAAAIVGTLAERPYDTNTEFDAILHAESAILAEADK